VHEVATPTSRCTVWWAAPVDPESAPALVDLLDEHERDRLARFRRPADRERYLAAHALARLVLAPLVGTAADALAFDRTCRCGVPHGKPVLPGGPGFSLSHAVTSSEWRSGRTAR
jgi:4'-phosphopantetheinyl transferase